MRLILLKWFLIEKAFGLADTFGIFDDHYSGNLIRHSVYVIKCMNYLFPIQISYICVCVTVIKENHKFDVRLYITMNILKCFDKCILTKLDCRRKL